MAHIGSLIEGFLSPIYQQSQLYLGGLHMSVLLNKWDESFFKGDKQDRQRATRVEYESIKDESNKN